MTIDVFKQSLPNEAGLAEAVLRRIFPADPNVDKLFPAAPAFHIFLEAYKIVFVLQTIQVPSCIGFPSDTSLRA